MEKNKNNEHLESLLIKINSADNKCKDNLIRIAHDNIFMEDEKLFDLILSQSNIHSQNIIYEAIKQGINSKIMYLLMNYSNGYIKQQRILKYANCKAILDNEVILNDMLNIKNEYVEGKLFELFKMDKIPDINVYSEKKSYFSSVANFKGLFKKEDEKLTEIDYQELKHRRILKDNVLKDVKKVLRNFGFLGIDIPRVNDKNQDKNDILNGFNKDDYQKLFNVDDFGDDRLFVNGTITNPKSDCNFVELVVILKELLKKYHINNYNVNIYDEDIYNLTRKYTPKNVSLVSDESDIIKFTSNIDVELTNISKFENNIVFNIKIDKLVDYIVEEKKENSVTEENLRDTLIYVNKEMEDDSNLYNSLIDKYLYDYHAIIAYEEDIPRDKLCNYCIKNNIKFIGFFEEENFKMINSESLIKSKTFDGPKKLILKSNEGEGEK